jgi:hypothetical protein
MLAPSTPVRRQSRCATHDRFRRRALLQRISEVWRLLIHSPMISAAHSRS